MHGRSLDYQERAAAIIRDQPEVRDAVTGATLHFDRSRARAYSEIDAEAWRIWARDVKSHTLMHLDRYLVEAERNLVANGVRVHWAATAEEARRTVQAIAERHGVTRVVKGKSMLSEELGVNALLESLAIEVFETDLGEYILQLLDEPPSHILGPAIHRSLDDIRQLFHERFNTPADASPAILAERARRLLREAFLTADMGITGGNFVVAETGTLALIENEGNIRLSTSVPRVHVALVGIEKLLPRWTDLGPFLQLTARAATGQPMGTFVSLIQGPRTFEGVESDGPEDVHVVLVDNGRSRVLADPRIWEALRCVRCGACLNVCPVYRQTGGHAYGSVYSGPIGAVLNPGLIGLEQTHSLPFASSLCGACYDVCPVRIDIPAMLLEWRQRAVDQGLRPAADTRMMKAFAAIATRPTVFRAVGRAFRAMPQRMRDRLPLLKGWTTVREGIKPAGALHRLRRGRPALPVVTAGPTADEADAVSTEPHALSTEPGPVSAESDPVRLDPVSAQPDPVSAQPDPASAQSDPVSAEPTDRTRNRRAFASGVLGRSAARSMAHTPDDGTVNSVMTAVGAALDGRTRLAHPGALARPVPTSPVDPPVDLIERFSASFRANGGEVVSFGSAAEASAWVAALNADFDTCDVGLLVPEHLSPIAAGLPAAPPEIAALGVSSAVSAAADTGTVVLDSRDGRRTQLLPPVHLIWIREATIRDSLNEALEALSGRLPAAIGLHSGPSKSADIGRVVVTGVHGPGRVMAAIVP